MQPSARQQELERLYNARKGHVPQISISDDTHHITEAIGSYYDDEDGNLTTPSARRDARPLSYMNAPPEVIETSRSSKDRRQGSYFDVQNVQPRSPVREKMMRTRSHDSASSPVEEDIVSPLSPRSPSIHRMGSRGSMHGQPSPPPLSRQSSETAVQQFPLNDIDYESSPAAVAQELSNLQAIRRMSMNVDMADPDLPSFSGAFGSMPTVAPKANDDTDDPSRLFWVPARLHPELAPKEFKTFVEDRVEKIRRRSGGEDSLSPDSIERTGSSSSSLRRKKSMLSHQIDTKGNYEDGAERLERKRSSGIHGESNSTLADLESLVNDPAQVIQRVSADTIRRSEDSGIEVSAAEDMPILPPVSQSLKRSTRTTYRRGSLKKGERAPFSKRSQQRYNDSDSEPPESPNRVPAVPGSEYFDRDPPILGLTRVQTEPIAPTAQDEPSQESRPSLRKRPGMSSSQSIDDFSSLQIRDERESSPPELPEKDDEEHSPPPPPPPQHQPRQFQSRLASGGRTTAQLPGYNNTNPLPHIIETLADGTKVPVGSLAQQQQYPERRSSHEHSRPQRGGAHMRPVPGRQSDAPSSTLDDISSHPSPLPGSGNTRTDALTMVPTFEERKGDKKDTGRKSSWKWILGNDDDSKKSKEESDPLKSKLSRLGKQPAEKARLDVLQNSIDGTAPSRGRESIVLNREDIRIEDDRSKKDSKKSSDSSRKDKDKEPGLLQAIFGGKKKTSESDLKEKKRKSDRRNSPDLLPRILKPDIDYNWTRFSILEERAIYRMAHIKLANPRRALYSQVLLSNFMYSYLAKVQMMHPQIQIPASQQKAAQQNQPQQQGSSKQGEQQQSAGYNQYQRYQEEQQRRQEEADAAEAAAREQQLQLQQQQRAPPQSNGKPKRSSLEILTGASVGGASQQQHRPSYDQGDYDHGYDADDQHHYQDYEHHRRQSSDDSYEQQYQMQQQQRYASHQSRNGNGGYYEHDRGHQSGAGAASSDYSVASTHDYLGHEKSSNSRHAFGSQNSLWDDEPAEELW